MIPYQDSDLERLHAFLRHLAAKLARRRSEPACQFDDEVRLEYHRLQKIGEGSIPLGEGAAAPLDGPAEVGSGVGREGEEAPLSQLIHVINERFGTDFNEADQLFFDQIVEAAVADDALRETAAVNPEHRFELVFGNLIERLSTERMDQNEEIFIRYMNDDPFRQVVSAWMASEAYRRLRPAGPVAGSQERFILPVSGPKDCFRARRRTLICATGIVELALSTLLHSKSASGACLQCRMKSPWRGTGSRAIVRPPGAQ